MSRASLRQHNKLSPLSPSEPWNCRLHNCNALRPSFRKSILRSAIWGAMSGSFPRACALIAVGPTLLMAGVGVTMHAKVGRAEDCLAGPNSAAPPGSHWHYRLDRATQRKCWYVRAPGQPAQQATAPDKKGTSTSTASTPVPSGPPAAVEAAPATVSPGGAANAVKSPAPV